MMRIGIPGEARRTYRRKNRAMLREYRRMHYLGQHHIWWRNACIRAGVSLREFMAKEQG